MILYHFTDKAGLTEIDPKFFGQNSYTANDARFSIKRAFFYNTREPAEHIFKSASFRYSVLVDNCQIYNLDTDSRQLKARFRCDIDAILNHCKKYFYGVSYTTSFKTFCLFRAVAVDKVKIRKAGIYEN